jgi:two-component system NarL family response regulator
VIENKKKLRILIVDDHAGMREGIAAIIDAQPDMTVAGEAADGQEAIRQFKIIRPEIAIVDFNLPVLCGVAAIRAIRLEFPEPRFLVITAANDDDCIRQALCAGAQAYLHKDMLRRELLSAIRALRRGQQYIPQAIAERLKLDL